MSNIVSSAIFCARNVDKAENQDKVGRWAVAAGQAKKVVDYVVKLDTEVGKNAQEAVNLFKKISEKQKVIQYAGKYAGKAVDIASRNVNPLICVSSAIDVLQAKDKESALVTNATALSAMFAGESLMKKHLDDVVKIKGIDEIAKKVLDFAAKHNFKGLPAIVHGAAFVVGSCAAYSVGEKFGNLLLNKQ